MSDDNVVGYARPIASKTGCPLCGRRLVGRARRCRGCRGIKTPHVEGARVSHVTPFWDDDEAIEFVLDHPDGASLEEVAEMMGINRSSLLRIEAIALAKLAEFKRIRGLR
jgi:hypothetical protein